MGVGSFSLLVRLLVGTLIINLLSIFVAHPIGKWWAERRIGRRIIESGMSAEGMAIIYKPQFRGARFVKPATARKKAQEIADNTSVLTDVAILGMGGFLAGCFGFWFVGFPLSLKGLPGVGAFIGASVLGAWTFGHF